MLGEADYADECLGHARTLFKFADEYRGKYTDTIPAGGFYESWSGFNDEIVWAAAWIAKVNLFKCLMPLMRLMIGHWRPG